MLLTIKLVLNFQKDIIPILNSGHISFLISKGKICTLNCPLDELAILKLIIENPNITQKEIANRIGKSERTVKNKVASLKEKGYIRRLNGKRNGKWEVLIEFD